MKLPRRFSEVYGKKQGRIVRFKLEDEYVYFDRRIFQIYILALLVVVVIAQVKLGVTDFAYASCPDDAIGGVCSNDLYGKCDLPACQVEELNAGETVGEPPPPAFDLMLFCVFTFGLVAFIFNSERKKQNMRLYREQLNNKK